MKKAVIVISGIPGAGKSTISALLARQFERGVHLEAEALQRCIVSGGHWPNEAPQEEAMRQLRLRGQNVAVLADSFFAAGFTAVVDDMVIGRRLMELRSDVRSRPLFFVLLLPQLEVVRRRNAQRPNKDVFAVWQHLHDVTIRETPRLGLWLDTSGQTPEESMQHILARMWTEGEIV